MQVEFAAGAGMSIATGSGGNDALDGSADPDEMSGLEGDDTLHGHGGDDTLHGHDGNDTLYGDAGNDALYGDGGDDDLHGGSGDDTLDGGAGDDTLEGGAGGDTVVFRDGYGHDVVMDFDPAEDRVSISSGGLETWEDVKARLHDNADGSAVLTLDDGSTLCFQGVSMRTLSEDDFVLSPPPVCFAAGTLIAVPGGEVAVERLRAGDLVRTLDHGAQPLLWTGRRRVDFGHGPHRHHPVRITAGAMGGGLPHRDLMVSPQHRLLVAGPAPRGVPAGALARARGLCGRPGIAQVADCTSIVYVQILLPRHGIVLANGAPAETFLPRAFGMATLPPADRAAVLACLPALARDAEAGYGPPARPILPMGRILALPPAALLAPTLPALSPAPMERAS